jgi:ERCC4-type nuclease
MILLDDRAGSIDLLPYLKALTPEVTVTRLEFGDIAWAGEGPSGGVSCAVEHKSIDDLLQCIGDGRFVGHQLPGLRANYDRIYLVVEGRIRTDRTNGVLQKMKGDRWQDIVKGGRGYMYRDLEHFYGSMEEMAQVRVKTTFDPYESARYIAAKYSWWTAKGWEDHKSLKQFHVPPPPAATFNQPSLVRRVAKEFDSIGWERSIAVEAKFKSVREMVNANERTWREVEGVGKVIAHRIVTEIDGGTK